MGRTTSACEFREEKITTRTFSSFFREKNSGCNTPAHQVKSVLCTSDCNFITLMVPHPLTHEGAKSEGKCSDSLKGQGFLEMLKEHHSLRNRLPL